MGWKASCTLISEWQPGYLGTLPEHDPEAARRLIADLGLGPHRSRGMTSFDVGIYPEYLTVGAYLGAAVIGTRDFAEFSMGEDPPMRAILARFPDAEVLRVGLHSVVNFWSYEFFDRGRLVRAYGGSADDGVVVDFGELLPEERPHFERSEVRHGERVFFSEINGKTEEFDPSSYGEVLVFELMGRFFGSPMDHWTGEDDPFDLTMESFERARTWRRWWPWRSSKG